MVFFLLFLAVKFPVLDQPPVWDGSMSVFPAAITLAENGFDIADLLSRPTYAEGGPNGHSVSLITWLTAVVIKLVGSEELLFPVLHLLHFAIGALAATGVFKFGRALLGVPLAAAATVTAFIFPLVLTQVGFMYLEIALLAATVWAILAWMDGRKLRAILWATAATLLKGSGIVVAVALMGMALLDLGRGRRRIRDALLIIPAPLVATWLQSRASLNEGATHLGPHLTELINYLWRVPDLLIILLVYMGATLLAAPWRTRSSMSTPPVHDAYLTSIAVLVATFLGFYFLMPLAGVSYAVLPRYYLQILPLALIGLVYLVATHASAKMAAALLALLLVFSVVNHDGRFYPNNDSENFALIERSDAYRGLLDLHMKGVDALVAASQSGPVFYAQPDHYRLGYPLMGYATGPLSNGHSIRHEAPFQNGRLEDFPDSFTALHDMNWLGGEIIADLWRQAETDPTRTVEVTTLRAGQFTSSLIHIDTVDR